MMQEFTLTLLQCKLLTTDTEKLCYMDGSLLEAQQEMVYGKIKSITFINPCGYIFQL